MTKALKWFVILFLICTTAYAAKYFSDLNVTGDLNVTSNLDVDGTGNVQGVLTAQDDIDAQSDLFVGLTSELDGAVSVGKGSAAATGLILDVVSTTGAFAPPRMTTAQRDALTAVEGALLYNDDDDTINIYDGTGWVEVSGSGGGGISNAEYNLVIAAEGNSRFEKDVTGWTGSTTAPTHNTSTQIEGDGSLSWDPAGAETLRSDAYTIPDHMFSKNGLIEIYYQGGDTDYSLKVLDGSNAEISSACNDTFTVQSDGSKRIYCSFVFPSSGSIKLSLEAGSDEPAIIVDRAYLGTNFLISSGFIQDVYSALVVDGAGTTTVSKENEDWIDGSCTNGSAGLYVCSFISATFTTAPNCLVNNADASNGFCYIQDSANLDENSVQIQCTNNAGTAADRDFHISCQKSGIDSPTETMTTDQSDFGWTDWTPSQTNGFGTITSVSLEYRRVGDTLEFRGEWTNGTVSAAEAQIELPNSYVISSSAGASTTIAGMYLRANGVATNGGAVLATDGDTFLNFGPDEAFSGTSNSALTTQNANSISASSERISFFGSVPIQGWETSNRAPQLVNSVINPREGVTNICSGLIDNAGTPTVNRSDGNCFASLVDNSVGDTTINFASGTFTGDPVCTCSTYDTSDRCTIDPTSAISSSLVRVQTLDNANAAADTDFFVICTGPK